MSVWHDTEKIQRFSFLGNIYWPERANGNAILKVIKISDWLFQKLYFGRLKGVKQGGNRAQSRKKEKLYLIECNRIIIEYNRILIEHNRISIEYNRILIEHYRMPIEYNWIFQSFLNSNQFNYYSINSIIEQFSKTLIFSASFSRELCM